MWGLARNQDTYRFIFLGGEEGGDAWILIEIRGDLAESQDKRWVHFPSSGRSSTLEWAMWLEAGHLGPSQSPNGRQRVKAGKEEGGTGG